MSITLHMHGAAKARSGSPWGAFLPRPDLAVRALQGMASGGGSSTAWTPTTGRAAQSQQPQREKLQTAPLQVWAPCSSSMHTARAAGGARLLAGVWSAHRHLRCTPLLQAPWTGVTLGQRRSSRGSSTWRCERAGRGRRGSSRNAHCCSCRCAGRARAPTPGALPEPSPSPPSPPPFPRPRKVPLGKRGNRTKAQKRRVAAKQERALGFAARVEGKATRNSKSVAAKSSAKKLWLTKDPVGPVLLPVHAAAPA